MCVKEVSEYYKLALNTLCMTNFVKVISYYACSCGIGKISVHNKTVIENPQKRRKDGDRRFLHDFSPKEMHEL